MTAVVCVIYAVLILCWAFFWVHLQQRIHANHRKAMAELDREHEKAMKDLWARRDQILAKLNAPSLKSPYIIEEDPWL